MPVTRELPGENHAEHVDTLIAAERARLYEQAGIATAAPRHFKRPKEAPFVRSERASTTLLFGGLTLRHEKLVEAALLCNGYRPELIPTPRKADFQAGKEYGNNGQCNPTYFTVGALVNYLKNLRDNKGLSTEEIIRDYVYLTAGACGPCRFGMYEAEYRLALRNSGFDGFRVIILQQSGGLNQTDVESGVTFNVDLTLSMLNAFCIGDVLNAVTYHVRPYETVAGKSDEVFARCLEMVSETMRAKDFAAVKPGITSRFLDKVLPSDSPETVAKLLDQLRGDYLTETLERCAALIQDEIEVDYLKPRPIVKITGEFWAQTTEGDGNFRMFPFLEREGAEVLVEPIATWLDYLIGQATNKLKDSKGVIEDGAVLPAPGVLGRVGAAWDHRKKLLTLSLARKLLRREYDRFRGALGGTVHELADQPELQRVAHPYYNTRAEGGEGHLEVAKAIYYCNHSLAHMVLSLKPFGCMPSTQSDGAQAAVVSAFPDLLYIPVETSGEGDVNAHSRVQMALGEAKVRAQNEFKACVERTGYTLEQLREYVAAHRELRRPLLQVPHYEGVVGRAANFALYVGSLMAHVGARGTN